jgi:hypothetical protein
MQQSKSLPPLETEAIAANRGMVIVPAAHAQAVRLDFSAPSVRGKSVVLEKDSRSSFSMNTSTSNRQKIMSPTPIETVVIAATRRMVIAPTAHAQPAHLDFSLDFSTPTVRGQSVVTGLTTSSAGSMSTRNDSESAFFVRCGATFSSEDILCVVNADQDDYRPDGGIKERKASSSDLSVSTCSTPGFGMATFSSQDLMYFDYTPE